MLALGANAGSTSYITHKELALVRILTINLSIDNALLPVLRPSGRWTPISISFGTAIMGGCSIVF